MLVAAQKNRVNAAELPRKQSGLCDFLQIHIRELIVAGIVEGRIG